MNLISISALKYSDSSFEVVDNNNLYKAAYSTEVFNIKTQIFLDNIEQLKDYNNNRFMNSCTKSDKEIVETYPLISFRKAYLEKRYNNTSPSLKMNVNGSSIRGWGQFFKELKNMSRGDGDIEFIISGEVSPGGALKNCSVANVSPKLQSFICAIMAQEGNFDKPGRVQGLRWRQRMNFSDY